MTSKEALDLLWNNLNGENFIDGTEGSEDEIKAYTIISNNLNRLKKLEILFEFLQSKMYVCPNFFEMRATSQKAFDECLHHYWTNQYNGFEVCDEITPKMVDLWHELKKETL